MNNALTDRKYKRFPSCLTCAHWLCDGLSCCRVCVRDSCVWRARGSCNVLGVSAAVQERRWPDIHIVCSWLILIPSPILHSMEEPCRVPCYLGGKRAELKHIVSFISAWGPDGIHIIIYSRLEAKQVNCFFVECVQCRYARIRCYHTTSRQYMKIFRHYGIF